MPVVGCEPVSQHGCFVNPAHGSGIAFDTTLGARFVPLEKIVALMASRLAGHFLRSQAGIKQFIFGMYLKKGVLLYQTKSFAETISCSE